MAVLAAVSLLLLSSLLLVTTSAGAAGPAPEPLRPPAARAPVAGTGTLAGSPPRSAASTTIPASVSPSYTHLLSLARNGGDVYAKDPSTIVWTNATVPNLPQAAIGASMVYDPARGSTILFGGLNVTDVPLNETWSYLASNGHWTELDMATAPMPRYDASMAYDALSGDLVLFGGIGPGAPGGAYGDCWVLGGVGSWQPCPSSATAPAPRALATFVSDPAMGGLVLYGGQVVTTDFGDTWLWTATGGWTQLNPTGVPPRQLWGMEGATLPGNAGIILYGGGATSGGGDHFYYDTYQLTPGDVFNYLGKMPQPVGMTGGTAAGAMAYLPGMHGAVLFGGAYGFDVLTATVYASEETWLLPWNTSAGTTTGWQELPVANVSGEWGMASTYDPVQGVMYIFGGEPSHPETSVGPLPVRTEFDQFSPRTNWTPALNDSAPPALAFPSIALDTSNGAIVLFGGATGVDQATLSLFVSNETWALMPDGTWIWEPTARAPPARAGAAFSYLPPPADEFVLFGGFTGYGVLNDTWTYRLGGAWTNTSGGVSPTGRASQSIMTVPHSDAFYMFGGLTTCGPGLPTLVASRFLNDTWEYTLSGWTNVTKGVAPGPRAGMVLAPTPTPGSALLAGGIAPQVQGCTTKVNPVNDSWSFNFTTRQWALLPTVLKDPATAFGCSSFDPIEHEDLYAFGISGLLVLSVGYSNAVWRAGANLSFQFAAGNGVGLSPTAPAPVPRAMGSCLYDPGLQGSLTMGGIGSTRLGPYTILGDTWTLRDESWNLSTRVSPAPQVGTPFLLNASSLDPYGAIAPRNLTFSISDSTGTLFPRTLTLVNGTGRALVVVTTASPADTIEACALALCVNLTIPVTAPAAHLALAGIPAVLTAGARNLLTVEMENGSGLPLPGWNGNASLAVPGGAVIPSTATLVNGFARLDVIFPRAGTNLSLWATAGALGAQEGPFTVLPSFLDQLNVTVLPSPAYEGSTVDLIVGGEDGQGNPITGRTVILSDSLGDVTRVQGTLQNGTLDLSIVLGMVPGSDVVEAIAGNESSSASLSVVPLPPSRGTTPSSGPSLLPWYLVVIVAVVVAALAGIALLAEHRRREALDRVERSGKGKSGSHPDAEMKDREKEKTTSGFLAFIPAEEEEGGPTPDELDR